MKKITYPLFLFILLTILCSCSKTNFQINIENGIYDLDDSQDLYLPTPLKNNSIFLGYEVVEEPGLIINNLDYRIIKKFMRNKQINLLAVYQNLTIEELFSFQELDNSYEVRAQKLASYPRKITIPATYKNKKVSEISSFGFRGIEELVIVNLSANISKINQYAFASTSVFKISNQGAAEVGAFSNTLITSMKTHKIDFNFLKDFYKKDLRIGNETIEVKIDLNGGKIIAEELDLVVSRPVLVNKVFESYINEEGREIIINNDLSYQSFSLKEYYRDLLGFTYKIKARDFDESLYSFTYLEDSDSYALSLFSEELALSKLILPNLYLEKPITEIRTINNNYLSELVLGKNIVRISGELNTPNLRRINLTSQIIEINSDAFINTLLKN